jgi:hypothetical protein
VLAQADRAAGELGVRPRRGSEDEMRSRQTKGAAHQQLGGFLTFAVQVAVLVGALLIALFLLMDATAVANTAPDPTIGRVRGAYTLVELWLGLSRPASLVRIGEIVLAVAITVWGFVRIRRRYCQAGAA